MSQTAAAVTCLLEFQLRRGSASTLLIAAVRARAPHTVLTDLLLRAIRLYGAAALDRLGQRERRITRAPGFAMKISLR